MAGNPAKCIATAEWSVGESCVIPTCKELIPDRSSGQPYYDCNDENGNEVEMNGSVENLFDNVADTLLQLDNGNSLSLVLEVSKHN